MKKKLLLTFALLLTAVTGAWALTPNGDDVWNETTKTLTVNSNPEANAYSGKTEIQHLVIASGVTSISNSAFNNCINIATMTVEAGNTVYDSRNDCNAIIEKSTNTLIAGCKNTTIPDDVTSIGEKAFVLCTSLTSIEIPASVTSIGVGVFASCDNLATVTVYAPSCTLGGFAFSGCNKLTNIYVFSDRVEYYKGAANWNGYAGKITAMTPVASGECGKDNPGDVTWRLEGQAGHYRLTISGTGAMADYSDPSERTWDSYATEIETVIIEDDVTTIGDYAFGGCSGLTEVTFATGSMLETIGEAAFYDCTGLTTVTIPASVTTIGDYAFGGCSGLTTVTIPASVTTIGDEAFLGCESLTTVTIPASVTYIGYAAFVYCSNIATMTVEAGNTVYDSRNGCNAIIEKESNTLIFGCKNTIIPDDVTSIGEYNQEIKGETNVEIIPVIA